MQIPSAYPLAPQPEDSGPDWTIPDTKAADLDRLQEKQSWFEADYLSGSQLKTSTTEYPERQGGQTPDGFGTAPNMYDLRAAYKALILGFVRKEGVSAAPVQSAAPDPAQVNDA